MNNLIEQACYITGSLCLMLLLIGISILCLTYIIKGIKKLYRIDWFWLLFLSAQYKTRGKDKVEELNSLVELCHFQSPDKREEINLLASELKASREVVVLASKETGEIECVCSRDSYMVEMCRDTHEVTITRYQ